MPLLLRYTTPVNGSSSRDPTESTGNFRALAYTQAKLIPVKEDDARITYCKSVDHGFQAHVDLASADNLSHILNTVSFGIHAVKAALRWGHLAPGARL